MSDGVGGQPPQQPASPGQPAAAPQAPPAQYAPAPPPAPAPQTGAPQPPKDNKIEEVQGKNEGADDIDWESLLKDPGDSAAS